MVMPGGTMEDKLTPWKVWGWYEVSTVPDPLGQHPASPDHQIAHVEVRSIEFVYTKLSGDETNREFMVEEVNDLGGVVVVRATNHMSWAKPWEIYIRQERKIDAGVHEWVLYSPSTQTEIERTMPMTKKYWIWRLAMWPVLGINSVLWLGLLLLLWYNFG